MKIKNIFKNNKVAIVLIILVLFFLVLNISTFSLAHQYNSDDVALQLMFDKGVLFGTNYKWFGISMFLFKLPILYLVSLFSNHNRVSIYLASLVANLAGLLLFLSSGIYFAKQWKLPSWSYIPLLWVTTLTGTFAYYLFNINSRNIEIGIIFATLALVHKYIHKTDVHKYLVTALSTLLALLWGFIMLSDSFYIYMFVVPVALFVLWMAYKNEWALKYLRILGFILLSFISYIVLAYIARKFNYVTYKQDILFGGYKSILEKLLTTPYTLVDLVGSSFFGDPVLRMVTIQKILNSIVVIFGLFFTYKILRMRQLIKDKFVFVFLVILFSNYFVWLFSDKYFSYYLILIPFLIAVICMFGQSLKIHLKGFLILIISLAILINIGYLLKTATKQIRGYPNPNHQNVELVKLIRSTGASKGYALFWDSGINTYLAGNNPVVIQTQCTDQGINIHHWYLNQIDLEVKTSKSFYIFNNQNTEGCQKEALTKQFGPPGEVIPFENYEVYVYDRDILQ